MKRRKWKETGCGLVDVVDGVEMEPVFKPCSLKPGCECILVKLYN